MDNYYCPDELIKAIYKFVKYYNNERYLGFLNNVTLSDLHFGCQEEIIKRRELIKKLSDGEDGNICNKKITANI